MTGNSSEPVQTGPALSDAYIVYQRESDVVGALGPGSYGLGMEAFGGANGPFLATLMDKTRAPIASRWQSITLRRALLSRVPTPFGIKPANWVAARASLLTRMGEADSSRMLIQAIDPNLMTTKFAQAVMASSLASSDPAGLCSYAPFAVAADKTLEWQMGEALCAGLAGEASRGGALIDRVQNKNRDMPAIDAQLTEKVIGASANRRRSAKAEWGETVELTPWRFGLANATNVAIPDKLFATAPIQMRAWAARAPMLDAVARIPFARDAARLGVFSSVALVDAYSAAADAKPQGALATDINNVRTAFAAGTVDDRLTAMRALWAAKSDPYTGLILTARAAARIEPDADFVDDSGNLIASMLTAGMDRTASRWSDIIDSSSNSTTDLGWALLAVGSPDPKVAISTGRVGDFVGRQDTRKSAMLIAGLAGLGRLDLGSARTMLGELGYGLDQKGKWSTTLEEAANRTQPGTVVVLAGLGMSSPNWADIPPSTLFHILSAYRRVGLESAARMIAAEAITRS